VARRRDIIWDIQRHLPEQAYYLYGPSERVVAAASWPRGSTA